MRSLTSERDSVLAVTGGRRVLDQVRSVVQDTIRIAGRDHEIRVRVELIQDDTDREPNQTDLPEREKRYKNINYCQQTAFSVFREWVKCHKTFHVDNLMYQSNM